MGVTVVRVCHGRRGDAPNDANTNHCFVMTVRRSCGTPPRRKRRPKAAYEGPWERTSRRVCPQGKQSSTLSAIESRCSTPSVAYTRGSFVFLLLYHLRGGLVLVVCCNSVCGETQIGIFLQYSSQVHFEYLVSYESEKLRLYSLSVD